MTRPAFRPTLAYRGAVRLQRLLIADADDPGPHWKARCEIASALAGLEEMKRKIRQKPLAKPINVQIGPTRSTQRNGSSSMIEDTPEAEPISGEAASS